MRRIARLGLALYFGAAILRIAESWFWTVPTCPAVNRLLNRLLLRDAPLGEEKGVIPNEVLP